MAWKLKKATPERGTAAEPGSPSAGEQTIDYADIAAAAGGGAPASFAPNGSVSNGEADGGGGGGGGGDDDFLASRTQAAEDAVDSFNFARQSGAGAGKPAEAGHDDWSLDAFAPYQPPSPFDFNEPTLEAASDPALSHSGLVDFDAEPESALGSADSAITSLSSIPLQASEFGVVDFDLDAPVGQGESEETDEGGAETLHFASVPDLSSGSDEDWQLGVAGMPDAYEAQGTSSEPTLLSGLAAPVSDAYALPHAPAMPLEPQPAFDEPSDALSALHAPIPMPLPLPDLTPPEPEPVIAPAPAAPAGIDKTLLYGEAADEPGIAAPAAAQPQLIVKFGPFSASYPITADDLVIGRPDPNTGVAPPVSLEYDDAVSRRHARVYSDGGQVMLEDLGSKNGTLLNGSAIRPNRAVPLKPGDTIRIGERTEISFVQ